MNKKVIIPLISLLIIGCGIGPLFGTTEPPAPAITSTPKPITAENLSAVALKSTDLPAGFVLLSENDLQNLQELQSVVTTDFPDISIVGLTAYGSPLDTGKYEAVVLSFYFFPLNTRDIATFDNPELAMKTFSHGANRVECVDCGTGNYIGDYSANLSLSLGDFVIDEVVGRENHVGFAAMVVHGGGTYKLDLATTAARKLQANVQTLLGEQGAGLDETSSPTSTQEIRLTSTPVQIVLTFTVDARESTWLDTGIIIHPYDEIKIDSSGTIDFGGVQSGPDGNLDVQPGYGILPTAPYGALVGMIGSGEPFIVGSNFQEIAQSKGVLKLLINDVSGQYTDNSGQFQVTITITKGK